MPDDIYDLAKDMAPSTIVGQIRRRSGTGALDVKTQKVLTVNRNVYQWGDRLPAGLAPKLDTKHKPDPYAGTVRFNTGPDGLQSSARKSVEAGKRVTVRGDLERRRITKTK